MSTWLFIFNGINICNVDREVFQRRAIDFNRHTEDDHNKWHYLYFFAYLKERKHLNQTNMFTEQEEYPFTDDVFKPFFDAIVSMFTSKLTPIIFSSFSLWTRQYVCVTLKNLQTKRRRN